jgi:hypothetical protein
VGHHGSRNATPKSLWKLFKNKSEKKASNRLLSLMSTMEGKHGDVHSHTEVPRETLVHELQRESDLFTTQQLQGKQFFHDTVVTFWLGLIRRADYAAFFLAVIRLRLSRHSAI